VAVTTWAPVASATAAALAATASWVSVQLTRTTLVRARRPVLDLTALVDGATGSVTIEVENVGGGIARDAVVILAEGGACLIAAIPPAGRLAPGRRVQLETPLTRSPQAPNVPGPVGVAICQDLERNTHAWTANGVTYRRWSPRRLKRRPLTNEQIFGVLLPEVDLSTCGLVGLTNWREIAAAD
jgi:hypothetical protein